MRFKTTLSTWLPSSILALVCALGTGRAAFGQPPVAGPYFDLPAESTPASIGPPKEQPAARDQETVPPIPSGDAQPSSKDSAVPGKLEEATGRSPGGAQTVREELPLFYARDRNGNLVPLLGFSYEELLDFSKQKQQKDQQASKKKAAFGQLVITGQVEGDRAELTAKYAITVDEEDWIQIPLLQGAVLLEPAVYKGEGKHAIEFDPKSGTYSLRLHAKAKSVNEFTLKLAAPIKNIGAERRLELEVPAAAASQLVLNIPTKGIALAGHQGATTVELKKNEGEHSTIEAWGIGGAVSLAWNPPGAKAAATSTLESTGQIQARIDSRSVQFDARLTVRSLSGEFDRFRVKLPPGAQWIPIEHTSAAGYSVKLTENPATGAKSAANQVVEIRLAQNTVGPVDVQLKAERAHDVVRSTESLQLAGFEVLEAVPHRQWGYIAVSVVGDWRVVWGNLDRVRQIADLPSNMPRKDVVAGFEYFGQASLPVRLTARKTRIVVEPQYTFFVEPRKVRLEAKLNYAIRGAKAFSLDLEIPGWTIDEIGPAELTDIDAILSDDGSTSTIILSQATIGDEKIVLTAHRELPPDATSVELTIPTPHADVVGPASVVIVPANNLRLKPRDLQMQGLVRQSASNTSVLPDLVSNSAPTLAYRVEQLPAVFAADIERLSQAIASSTENSIDLKSDEIRVEQRLTYRVDHEPLDSIRLDVPRTMASDSTWRLSINGQRLLATPASPADSERVQVEVLLDEPRIGIFQVVSQFQLPQTALVNGASVLTDVPLVVPLDGSSGRSKLSVSSAGAIRIQMRDELWSVDPEGKSPTSSARPALHFVSDHPDEQVGLALSVEDRRGLGETTVQQAWLQTWLGDNVRQDRAVYRLTSTDERLQISLPTGFTTGNLEVRLDGLLVTPQEIPGEGISIFLPESSNGPQHTLEMRYSIDLRERRTSTTEIEFPRFKGNAWIQHMYWQLALPNNEHLVYSPTLVTPEFSWGWNGLHWQRFNRMEQSELEQWIAAEHASELPIGTNQYLFSVGGPIAAVTIQSASRWELVAWASASALAAGLLFIYLPALRRSWLILVASVVMIGLAIWQSSIALLIAQSAVAGVVLAIIGGLIERFVSRRQQVPVIVRSAGSSIVDRGSTRPQPRFSDSPILPSTDVVPVDMESSSVHSTTG